MGNEPSTISYDPEDRFHEAIASFEGALDAGLNPGPAEWLARYPDVAACLQQYFTAQQGLRRLADSPLPASPVAGLPRPFGAYELLEEIGRGGMGVVYKARQIDLNRLVAVKLVLAGGHAGPEELTRIRTEAEAVARLQHPHIVQIFEVGEHESLPFLALEFCPGGSLKDRLGGAPLGSAEAARLTEQLAQAAHAAHAQNVVHRDLKPANVLLAADGAVKVSDFGLAKRLDVTGQTASGAIMGTPSYMAPEQARGQSKAVGPAADVYALGAILYELLTGRPPFHAANQTDTLLQVITDEPVPPRELQPKTPRDLETICLKCLQKEPRKRFASAKELAEDLRRFLAGEPVAARPTPRWERGLKWTRRHPAVAALCLMVFLALAGVTAGAVWYINALQQFNEDLGAAATREKKNADEAVFQSGVASKREREALKAQEKTEKALAQTATMLAQSRSNEGTLFLANEALEKVPTQFRFGGWRYLKRQLAGSYATLHGHTKGVTSVSFSPDGLLLASVGLDRTIRLWDARSGAIVRTVPGFQSVSFSPDGLLAAPSRGEIKIWNAQTGQEVRTLQGMNSTVAFSPDGLLLASVGGPFGGPLNGVTLWNVRTGKRIRTLLPMLSSSRLGCLAFSADGRLVAAAHWVDRMVGLDMGQRDTAVHLWNITEPGELPVRGRPLLGHTKIVQAIAFSPDGRLLASASADGTIKLWDVRTGQPARRLEGHNVRGYPFVGTSVAFSPDGLMLASGNKEGEIKLWDTQTGQEVRTLRGHGSSNSYGMVSSLSFSPDGLVLASGSDDGTVKLWDVRPRQEVATLRGHAGRVANVAFSPDGALLASVSVEQKRGTLILWDTGTGQVVRTLGVHTPWAAGTSFSPMGLLLACGSDRTVKLWDVRTDQQIHSLQGHTDTVMGVAFSPTWPVLASASRDRTVKLWNAHTGQEIRALRGHKAGVTKVAFSPDGGLLASASEDDTVKVWTTGTGREIHTLPLLSKNNIYQDKSLAFSHDGRLLAASSGITVKVWDTHDGKEVHSLRGHISGVVSVAFGPDDLLASGSHDGTVKLWDANTGQELASVRGHTLLEQSEAISLAFSRDGLLASGSADRTIKLWDARTMLRANTGPPSQEERRFRQLMTQADPFWHEEQSKHQEDRGNHFAAAFHLARLVEIRPSDPGTRQRFVDVLALLARQEQDRYQLACAHLVRRVPAQSRRYQQTADLAAGERLTGSGSGGLFSLRYLVARHKGKQDQVNLGQTVVRACTLTGNSSSDADSLRQLAENAVQFDPQNPDYRETLGAVLYRAGQHAEAFSAFARGAGLRGKGNAPSWTVCFLAMVNHKLGHSDKARALYAGLKTVGRSPAFDVLRQEAGRELGLEKGADFWFQQAVARAKLSQWDQAVVDLSKAIDLEPGVPAYWNQRGVAYYRKGQWAKAIDDFSGAVQRDPNNPTYWTNRGDAQAKFGQWDRAITDFSRAIALNPDYEIAWYLRGRAQASLGRWDKASADLARAGGFQRISLAAWSDQALVRLQLKDSDGYRQACARLVKNWGNGADTNATALVAWTCSIVPDAGVDLENIVQALEKAKPTVSATAAYPTLRALGAALYRAGEFEAAAKHLTKAAELRKQPAPSTWFFLAMAHYRLGNRESAKAWLEKANNWLEQSPNKPAADRKGRLTWDDLPWNERATLELLGREARGLLQNNE